jgi:hypothetical protein
MNLEGLKDPGIFKLGLNNSSRVIRPNMWVCVDSPSSFLKSVWLDPTIAKFCPICHTDKQLLDNDSGVMHNPDGTVVMEENPETHEMHPKLDPKGFQFLGAKVRECPNVMYYRRNEHFKASQFLWEDTFNWGNHSDLGGARSVLLVAVRLLYQLGFRTVYLLGVDFDMSAGVDSKDKKFYAFPQERTAGSIRNNNNTYKTLIERFTELKPIFDKEDFKVFNCNPDSALKIFPHVPIEQAIINAKKDYGRGKIIDIQNENTFGLYDREDRMKKEQEAKVRGEIDEKRKAEVDDYKGKFTEGDRVEIKAKLDAARMILEEKKNETKNMLTKEPRNDPAASLVWVGEMKRLKAEEELARHTFRMIEDEKRFKHGEPIRWGFWSPPIIEENSK